MFTMGGKQEIQSIGCFLDFFSDILSYLQFSYSFLSGIITYTYFFRSFYHICKVSQQFIIMSHKQKLEQFRLQIRNKGISQIIAQKRFWRDYDSQNCNLVPQIQPINLTLLLHIAKVAQFQQNVEALHRLGWHKKLAHYLSPDYNFTEEQRLSAAALCNIMYVTDFQEPSQSFTRNILQILEGNSSIKTLESILTLIFNLAHDHKAWLDSLVLKQNLIYKLVKLFSFQNLNHTVLYNLLLTICQIVSLASYSQQFLKFAPPIFNLINTNLALDSQFLSPTMFCLCQLSKKFKKEISLKMIQSRFFKKTGPIIKILTDIKVIDYYVTLANQTVEDLQCETFEVQIFPILCQKIMTSTLKLKLKIIRLIYNALQQKKLDLELFWKNSISSKLLELFQASDEINILEQLSYIFCICILNLKNRKKEVEQLISLLKRKRLLLTQNIDIQGLIDQTLLMYEKDNNL